jgi:endonuclease I
MNPLQAINTLAATLITWTLAAGIALAQGPPTGYYSTIDTSSSSALRSSLHSTIDDHQRYPYTSSGTDTWDILEAAQEHPNNSNLILDIYRNEDYSKQGGGNSFYNREHSWPNSYGFPDDGGGNYPYTDCHVLFLCDIGYNNSRGNKPFRYCSSSCTEETTASNNGQGGGSGSYPGQSNWVSSQGSLGTWETWTERRGDIARAQLYMDVRYEGGNHSGTGHWEPNLILTNNEALIASSATGNNETVAYMGMLQALLQWHLEDPVDDYERTRNDVVFSYQGNRNPFVDHPEWVDCLFNDACNPSHLVAFCFGDGSGASCPCNNFGAQDAGCANSTGAGATLSASGSVSLSTDDLSFSVTGLPTGPGLFFQGNNAVGGGNGLSFGSGLRCAGGFAVRLEIRFSSNGSSATTVALGSLSGATAGQTKRYQYWYRDSSGSPCSSTFNLTNGYELTWTL